MTERPRNALIVSTHDFRSRRKANIHFIAEELARRMRVRFYSAGFSALSYVTKDKRLSIAGLAGRENSVGNVDCYLSFRPIHPINFRFEALRWLENLLFDQFSRSVDHRLGAWVAEAEIILIESGLPVALVGTLKSMNPSARFVYIGSDDLSAIGCSPYLLDMLAKCASKFDWIRLASPAMANAFPSGSQLYYVPHGIDPDIRAMADPSPYSRPRNIVSVGSTMFDADAIRLAARRFGEFEFHIIGAGRAARGLFGQNIRLYDEMPFRSTLPFIKHADVGLAPYSADQVEPYLADTSMKLLLYGFFGLPAACPKMVAAGHAGRFGYIPGDGETIASAIQAALGHGRAFDTSLLTWRQVVDRILNPAAYSDTMIKA